MIKIEDLSQLSDVADADMAEVIAQIQQKQTVFEVVLWDWTSRRSGEIENFIYD